MKELLFIDTNIYLDFYEMRNESSLSLLNRLIRLRDKIIVSFQVEMEFKKKRKAIILKAIKPYIEAQNKYQPLIFFNKLSSKAIQEDNRKIDEKIKRLKEHINKLLEDPINYDPIYKNVQLIFEKEDDINLKRQRKMENKIRRIALKRFLSGFPPRKNNDTSIGDAINWEWIIEVASNKEANIIIVSRDSDYGEFFNNKSFLNEWLLHEFKEKVKGHKIEFSNKLSHVLKEFNQSITSQEENDENELLKQRHENLLDIDKLIEDLRKPVTIH